MLPLRALLGLVLAVGLVLGGGACFNSDQPSSSARNAPGLGSLNLVGLSWGRIVDVFDVNGALFRSDVLVRQTVQTDGVNFRLSVNPITEAETLSILQPAGTTGFNSLYADATLGLPSISTKSHHQPPPFTMVPRNAGIRLEFSELVDPATVTPETIQVWVGSPPVLRQSVRYVVQNDVALGRGFVLLDPTISKRQSSSLGLPQNAVGFPESFGQSNSNVLIRIPTEIDIAFGQPLVLRNLGGTRKIAPTGNDPLELSIGGDPVILRAMRSGNVQDAYRGFLQDLRRPRLTTQVQTQVNSVVDDGPDKRVRYDVMVANCQGLTPKVGDVLESGNGVLQVNAVIDATLPTYEVRGTVLEGTVALGVARLTTRYSGQDSTIQACYVTVSPIQFDQDDLPCLQVDPNASFAVRFDEPIDSGTVLSMHSMVLTSYVPGQDGDYYQAPEYAPETVADYIDRLRGYVNEESMPEASGGAIQFGPIEVTDGNRSFTLTPSAGVADTDEDGSLYVALALRDGSDGILDLAGNPLNLSSFVAGNVDQEAGAQITVSGSSGPGDAGNATSAHYFSLRALSVDEDEDGLAEYGGQFTPPGSSTGILKGRALQRYSRLADSSRPSINAQATIPTAMTPFEPLTPAGAVLMTVYRPHDLGFGYTDPNEFNIDIEGWNWSPSGGRVFDDTFSRFSLAFSHCNRMPDEFLNPLSALPQWPATGLRTGENFDNNILGFPAYDETVVFDSPYSIRAVNLFLASSGTSMLPSPNFQRTYTWRDTGIPQELRGAPNGIGAPPNQYLVSNPGSTLLWPTPPYGGLLDQPAPSVALPLLVRYRSFPMGEFLGVNRFQVTQMVPTSTLPAFRVYSAGGRDAGNVWNLVIPDNADSGGTVPVGGFDPNTGTSRPNHDSYIFWAQADFVVRVSRVHTHWFGFGGQLGQVNGVLMEPGTTAQPPGTNVILEYRGSVDVQRSSAPDDVPGPLVDAALPFDDYGDFIGTQGSVAQPTAWTTNLNELVGQNRYFQLRLTFTSNIHQNLESFMDGLGISWSTN